MTIETAIQLAKKPTKLVLIAILIFVGILYYKMHQPQHLENARVGIEYQSEEIYSCGYSGQTPELSMGIMPPGLKFIVLQHSRGTRSIHLSGIPERAGTFEFSIINTPTSRSRTNECKFVITVK